MKQESLLQKLRSPYGAVLVFGACSFAVGIVLGPFNIYPFFGAMVFAMTIAAYKLNRIHQTMLEANNIAETMVDMSNNTTIAVEKLATSVQTLSKTVTDLKEIADDTCDAVSAVESALLPESTPDQYAVSL